MKGSERLMDWMSCVKKVKAALAKQKFVYSQTRYSTITIDGKSESVRHDCSGYVSSCLYFFGAFRKNQMTTSWGFAKDSSIAKQLKDAGFEKHAWKGWNDLKEGDIITQPCAHVEIFSHNKDGRHYVYSNGKTSDCQNANPTPDGGRHRYTTVWRLKTSKNQDTGEVTVTPVVEDKNYNQTEFIKDIQKILGEPVDGKATKALLKKTPTVSAKIHRTHDVVRPIQKYFVSLGYKDVGEIDGEAGPKFTKAVKKYQKEVVKKTIDGEITAGHATWKKLLGL